MATDTDSTWFPLFELQDWTYQSVLVLPTSEDNAAAPGAGVTAKKWANGSLFLGQAFEAPEEGYNLPGGRLEFAPGADLEVSAKGTKGSGNAPASFEGTGIGTVGPLKGAIYQLDISKKDAKVCVRVAGAGRRKTVETVTTWSSMTSQILALREHLIAERITCAVMEDTSDYVRSEGA